MVAFAVSLIQPFLHLLAICSLLIFVLSIALIPWLVGRLRPDYFLFEASNTSSGNNSFSPVALAKMVLRNFAGLVLLCAGILMLFLPGQGLITIIISLALLDFPAKHRLIQKLVSPDSVRKSLNWIREKSGKPLFIWPKI